MFTSLKQRQMKFESVTAWTACDKIRVQDKSSDNISPLAAKELCVRSDRELPWQYLLPAEPSVTKHRVCTCALSGWGPWPSMVGEDQADHRHLIAGLQCCHSTGIALPCSADRNYTIDRFYSKTQLYVQL